MTYEFNQTFVAESFEAIYVERRRPALSFADLAQRYEFCEDLAQQVAESSSALRHAREISTEEVLSNCLEGLRSGESGVSEPEACWVTRRMAELLGWDAPEWLVHAEGGERNA